MLADFRYTLEDGKYRSNACRISPVPFLLWFILSPVVYSAKSEPTEDWTVEEVLKWWGLRANAESEAEFNTIVEGLTKQLEEGKKEIWKAHEEVSSIVMDSENVENQNVQNVNSKAVVVNKQHPIQKPKPQKSSAVATAASSRPTRSKKPSAVAAAAMASSTSAAASNSNNNSSKHDTIHIEVVAGPYEGKFFDLQPRPRSHCWLGRSSSAKFKDRGISLPLDLEVSTSHGKFEVKQGKLYYTDVASTNGTRINGEECEPNQPYELKAKGMTILAGQTTMKVTIHKLA